MNFYNIAEETRSSPYMISIKLSLKEIGEQEGFSTQLVLLDAMQSVIATKCSEYIASRYPEATSYFSENNGYRICCDDKNCHNDLVKILKSFDGMADGIYDKEIKGKSEQFSLFQNSIDQAKNIFEKYFDYAILNCSLKENEPVTRKRNKI